MPACYLLSDGERKTAAFYRCDNDGNSRAWESITKSIRYDYEERESEIARESCGSGSYRDKGLQDKIKMSQHQSTVVIKGQGTTLINKKTINNPIV